MVWIAFSVGIFLGCVFGAAALSVLLIANWSESNRDVSGGFINGCGF